MIRIVKNKFIRFQKECWFCACVFEYEFNDIPHNGALTCPCCYRIIAHDVDKGIEREEAKND